MDVLPRVIGGAAWRELEAGLIQRVAALNAFLEDLYVGERAAVRDGIVPWWLVTSSDGFVREAVGVPAPYGVRCLVAGPRPGAGRGRPAAGARGQPAQPVGRVLRGREPGPDDPAVPAGAAGPPGPAGRQLRRAAAAGAAQRRPGRGGRPVRGRHDPGHPQRGLLRARLPRPPDGRRAGRGQRPAGRRPAGLHAHDRGPPSGARDLPAPGRPLPRPGRLPQRQLHRRARPAHRGPGRVGDAGQRRRQRRGRRQGRLPLRPRPRPLLPERGAAAAQRRHLPAVGRRPAGGGPRPARRAGHQAGRRRRRLRAGHRPDGHRRGAGRPAGPDRGRPPRLHLPGGRAAVAGADRGRGRPRRAPRRPAAVHHLLGRRHRGRCPAA